MSNRFLPTDLPGVTFETTKRPIFNTEVADSDGGMSRRNSIQVGRVRYYFKVNYEFIYKAPQGVNEMFAFYAAMGGPADSFLYRDPTDNVVTSSSGTTLPNLSDGTTTTKYQLARVLSASYPFVEMVTDGPWTVAFGTDSFQPYIDGVPLSTGYSVGSTGLMTFSTGAAPAGSVITWAGNFYFRVHFIGNMRGAKFMNNFWEHQIEFESAFVGSVPTLAPAGAAILIDSVPDVDTA